MFNVLITGVGGQGVITLAEIIATAALLSGEDAKMTEVHGLAQRGGSLQCSIKIGKNIKSPLVSNGEVDLLISLEPLEALRVLNLLAPTATVVFDTHKIIPISVYSDKTTYPAVEEIEKTLRAITQNIFLTNGTDKVQELTGNVMALNIFMLGFAFYKKTLPTELTEEILLQSIKQTIGEKHFETNQKIFKAAALG
ncbi:indolepyruvate oxidoreductase subunit beta [Candidatus Falkowbacteria bacterium]|nr:indolepyruvate oxidoreductase subunit beta [Candidatus Falkowbacteria bacterium]